MPRARRLLCPDAAPSVVTVVRFWPNLVADAKRWGRETAVFNAAYLLRELGTDAAWEQLTNATEAAAALRALRKTNGGG